MMILGLNHVKKPRILEVSSSSSRLGSCDSALAPLSLMAGMIRAAAYMTKTRYASEMMTEGVMVMIAPTIKLKPVWMIEGNEPKAWRRVVYDAMMIGGRGGRAGSGAAVSAANEPGEGW